MDFCFDVLAQLTSEVQSKIAKEEACINHRKRILSFLRQCEAETINYTARYDGSADPNSQGKSTDTAVEVYSKDDMKDLVYHDDKDNPTNMNVNVNVNASQAKEGSNVLSFSKNRNGSRYEGKMPSDSSTADATVITDSTLTDILARAKSIRQAKAASAPGADGSSLGGRAGRNNASSHSSSRGGGGVSSITSLSAATSTSLQKESASALKRKANAEKAAIAANAKAFAATKKVNQQSKVSINKYHQPAAAGGGGTSKSTVIKSAVTVSKASSNEAKLSSTVRGVSPICRNKSGSTSTNTSTSTAMKKQAPDTLSVPVLFPTYPLTQCLTEQLNLLTTSSSLAYILHNHRIHNGLCHASDWDIPIPYDLLYDQSIFLSELQEYPCLSPSTIYNVVNSFVPVPANVNVNINTNTNTTMHSPQSPQQQQQQLPEHICASASDVTRQSRIEFERLWKRRIEKEKPAALLNEIEQKKIIQIWFLLRSCFADYSKARQQWRQKYDDVDDSGDGDIDGDSFDKRYEKEINSEVHGQGKQGKQGKQVQGLNLNVDSDPEKTKVRKLLHDLVTVFPRAQAYAYPYTYNSHNNKENGNININSSVNVNVNGLVDLEAYQDAYCSRVEYVAEVTIGAFLIKEVVRGLRYCCEHNSVGVCNDTGVSCNDRDRDRDRDSDNDFNVKQNININNKNKNKNKKWIEVLTAFKKLHCCLCSGAQDSASCVFLEK